MAWLEQKRKRKHSFKEIMSLLLPYLSRKKLGLIFVSVISFLSAIVGLITPQLIKYIIDIAIPSNNVKLVYLLGGAVLLTAAVTGLLVYATRFYSALYAQQIVMELRNDIYETLQMLHLDYYNEENTGQIMTRVTTDLNAIQSLVSFTLRLLMNGVIFFIGAYAAMISMNAKLGGILLALFPGFLWLVYWFSKKVRPVFYQSRTKFGEVTSILQENVTGAHVVRGFAQEESEIEKFDKANAEYRDLIVKARIYRSFYFSFMLFLIGLGASIVLLVGGLAVMRGEMGRGEFIAFISYLAMLSGPTRQLTWLVGIIQRALASGDRIIELLSGKKEVQEDPNAIDPPVFKGKIEYENVSFGYDEIVVLKNINVVIPPGQKVLILGGTGSGKTSFVNLIPRFYDPITGVVKIDDIDIKRYKLKKMRKQIGFVLQETFLFNATIKENIAFGNPEATIEEIIAAAKTAKIHDFISELPDGYQTRIGDRGITLSGGQKQRLSIARTLLTNPSILIFDDSTASVDAETEYHIQEALDILSRGRTTIIISQRISSVKYADRILVFDQGEIIQDGTHEELIKQEGIYKEIYETLAESYVIPSKLLAEEGD
ncbi:MAG: ABC transporter ATP-binding protein/permease [Candidatus Heimdallarchaeum endolithica]|uniref:ABC transporter ATP-binding protein/permease n=1 Tax=Candidatus Heimdallarchaeum endolithica TaxID=2876572 RepID=A0A9Y1BQV9_9ARCH|nr:MAG: ABC transporter ATP-binding protein/permease [Candidatus Heimdallarchaeum endolithica]